jgi:hypothetical protein
MDVSTRLHTWVRGHQFLDFRLIYLSGCIFTRAMDGHRAAVVPTIVKCIAVQRAMRLRLGSLLPSIQVGGISRYCEPRYCKCRGRPTRRGADSAHVSGSWEVIYSARHN